MKKKVLLIIVILITISIIIVEVQLNTKKQNIYDNDNELYVEKVDGIRINNSQELLRERYFGNLRIFNINFSNKDGVTNFSANVENTGKKDFESQEIELIFKNKDGSEYTRISGFIVDIPSGAINMINASIIEDKLNAYNFEIIGK